MIEALRISRRTLLRWLAWTGLLATAPRAGDSAAADDGRIDAPLAVFASGTGAAAVGRAYLRSRPSEADPGLLLDQLGVSTADAADVRALVRRLRERHRDDFRAGRITVVGGWTLSLTEARLAALAHLRSRS